jgi:chemosensory pili system protein ChpA (sensor histidine kinase/response regulator)
VVGATILGDGSVTPVVDLAEMLRTPLQARTDLSGTASSTDDAARMLPTALVVDDSLSARRSLAQLLSDSGFRVTTARDGLEAVEALIASRPDILFVDFEMPRMNGVELTAHVRSRDETRHLPIVMVTSRSTAKHREQAEAAGVNAYLTKPVTDDALLQTAQQLLEAR